MTSVVLITNDVVACIKEKQIIIATDKKKCLKLLQYSTYLFIEGKVWIGAIFLFSSHRVIIWYQSIKQLG